MNESVLFDIFFFACGICVGLAVGFGLGQRHILNRFDRGHRAGVLLRSRERLARARHSANSVNILDAEILEEKR